MYPGLRMLEVIKPATKHGIEIGYDASQAVPVRAPCFLAYPFAQRQQTFASDPTPPDFEAVAKKLKTLPSLPAISHSGFVDIEPKPVLFCPGSHFAKRALGLCRTTAQHHKIIGVAYHPIPMLFHLSVQRMKIDVGQKRADHRSLRRSSHWRPSFHPLDDVLTEKQTDQLKHLSIADSLFDPARQGGMLKGVEEALQVSVHHMGIAFLDQSIDYSQRLFGTAPGTKTVTGVLELSLEDRLNHQLHCRLHDAIFDRKNSQGAHFAVPFGNLDALDRFRPVFSALER